MNLKILCLFFSCTIIFLQTDRKIDKFHTLSDILKTGFYTVTKTFVSKGESMVEVVRISEKGELLSIIEVSDQYRELLYLWDEEE